MVRYGASGARLAGQMWSGSNPKSKKPTARPSAKPEDNDTLKIRRTIKWYNKHGNLRRPLLLRELVPPLRKMPLKKALACLFELEAKGPDLDNPSAWVLGCANKAGALKQMDPEAAEKVQKTISWYNNYGNLSAKLSFRLLMTPFANIKPHQCMKILNELGEKSAAGGIQDPTQWAIGYARRIEKEVKIRRAAWWHNEHTRLQQKLRVDDLVTPLMRLELWQAMTVFRELGEKASDINDPTAWVTSGARKWKDYQQERHQGLLGAGTRGLS